MSHHQGSPEGSGHAGFIDEVTRALAPLERPPCSRGEAEAARWIARRLERAGCYVSVEEEPAWGAWPPNLTALGLSAVVGALLAASGRRSAGTALALASAAGLADEVQNGPRLLRRLLRKERATVNVVAETGDRSAARTLVVLAHHDAAQTGRFFDQALMRWVHEQHPALLSRMKTQPPQWWLGLVAPVLTVWSSITARRGPALFGTLAGLASTAAVADIMRSPTVPGANDNLSGVGALVAVAEALATMASPGVKVLLVSCGAEESFQEGIRGFMDRHGRDLDPAVTSFINLDTIGSTHLVMLEGEGPIWMEDYADPSFRDLVESAAGSVGVPLERHLRARASTDSVIPSRRGYPTATITSLMPWRQPGNYHLMTDTPDRLHLDTVAGAVRVVLAVAERLARADG